ncbi:MAG TPA: UvrD-helicase domain-containing protein, partial [Caldilinea sp.]|nr:UvrD-helicase domain-containing protein [Caldilinea sp.]
MKFVADLHIHSHYSRATSKDLTLEHLWKWAQIKGVTVVATGDISHPGWLAELQQKLTPAEPGLFRLQEEFAAAVVDDIPPACRGEVRFLLGGEISNIYKRHGKTRKVHNLVFAPDLDTVGRLQARLERIGNIRSDGRPILGLDSRDLLEIALETHDRCHFIPAHIWTPWFAMLGSMSGFDSVEECFGDLTPHIFALETGLSSDPPMNWRVSTLDRYTLVSNSDAHSPPKLAREATCFDCDLSYDALFAALHSGDPATFNGTIEFFPEEGKYHVDGHRKCGVCWQPVTTLAHDKICPVCGKAVTVGVLHRIEMLADRPEGGRPARPHPYASLIPLPEVLSELLGVGAGSQRVQREYGRLLARLGSELTILRETRLEEIAAAGGDPLAQGIARMRRGAVDAQPGYDGEYGVVRVFSGAAAEAEAAQIALFTAAPARVVEPAPVYQPQATAQDNEQTTAGVATPTTRVSEQRAGQEAKVAANPPANRTDDTLLAGLNHDQRAAVLCTDAPLIISAGPGTGKTRTLTVRIAHLIRQCGAAPEAVLAITFTNKAAAELHQRLAALLGEEMAARATVKTFHAFGAQLLRTYAVEAHLDPAFVILDDEERRHLLAHLLPSASSQEIDAARAAIAAAK